MGLAGYVTIGDGVNGPFKLNLFNYGLGGGPEQGCEVYDIEHCYRMARIKLESTEGVCRSNCYASSTLEDVTVEQKIRNWSLGFKVAAT